MLLKLLIKKCLLLLFFPPILNKCEEEEEVKKITAIDNIKHINKNIQSLEFKLHATPKNNLVLTKQNLNTYTVLLSLPTGNIDKNDTLYGLYFDLDLQNELFDVNTHSKFKNNKQQNGQYIALKVEIVNFNTDKNNNNETFLLFKDDKITIQNDFYRCFTTIQSSLLKNNNNKLKITVFTYFTNFSWSFKVFDKIITISDITLFPMTIEKETNKLYNSQNYSINNDYNSIQGHNYNILMKFFVENELNLNFETDITKSLSIEYLKRNLNENILNCITYGFITAYMAFIISQLYLLYFILKQNVFINK
ncbi:hypothetical protein HANVADRAFT_2479 [Hanseniaspora valbyensis NRRL Y-1626]|uniref:GOLD domain-containing protein n=1 Tax=Hanseniaspora valbyensis NRRL Y-1626 TaxID=766949 RepID=A0A1B7TDR1_9ASCO|nr:hypothetical protein HANVADRAFT_2479 [Hanseniaspora valbyensis NRRL Y-1626]